MLYENGDYWLKIEAKGENVVTRIGIRDTELIAIEDSVGGARNRAKKLEQKADRAEERAYYDEQSE